MEKDLEEILRTECRGFTLHRFRDAKKKLDLMMAQADSEAFSAGVDVSSKKYLLAKRKLREKLIPTLNFVGRYVNDSELFSLMQEQLGSGSPDEVKNYLKRKKTKEVKEKSLQNYCESLIKKNPYETQTA